MGDLGSTHLTHLPSDGSRTARLRVLATSDLHMNVLGYDYVSDAPEDQNGLAGLATLIAQERAKAAAEGCAVLLLDNGDFLQGNALASWAAAHQTSPLHPVAAVFNLMSYDVVGLGNHDVDFGLPYLLSLSEQLEMPLVSTNLRGPDSGAIRPGALVSCPLPTGQGTTLTVGIVSVLPEQTEMWNQDALAGEAEVVAAALAVAQQISALRAAGADLVIALAHLEITGNTKAETAPANALHIAQLPGLDALVAGHAHRQFPGGDYAPQAGIDPVRGMIAQRPAIMPGHAASHLGVMDLILTRTANEPWAVIESACRLVPNDPSIIAAPAIRAACQPAHDATRAALNVPVGHTPLPLHNFFSCATATAPALLAARAKAQCVRQALQGQPEENLPLLATASAHTSGGQHGVENFLHIPAGPLLKRHIAGLDPFSNRVCALILTGQDIKCLLEHAARIFTRLDPAGGTKALLDSDIPSFEYDVIYGVDYVIDPCRAVGERVVKLCHAGQDVLPDQTFVLATTVFRATGGGGYHQPGIAAQVPMPSLSLSDALETVLRTPQDAAPFDAGPFRLSTARSATALMRTNPGALAHLEEIAFLHPKPIGEDADGFLELEITL